MRRFGGRVFKASRSKNIFFKIKIIRCLIYNFGGPCKCTCMFMCMYPWTHLQRPEGAIGCALLCHFPPTALRQGDRWTCRSPFLWGLAGQWAPRISLSCPVFNMVSWGTNSAPHAWVPDTDSCLQSQVSVLKKLERDTLAASLLSKLA